MEFRAISLSDDVPGLVERFQSQGNANAQAHEWTDAEYRAADGLSTSSLKEFIDDPLAYRQRQLGQLPERETTPALQFGKDAERIVFYDEIEGDPVIIPESALSRTGARRNNAGETQWSDWVEQNQGRRHLKQSEWDKTIRPLQMLRENVEQNRTAWELIHNPRTSKHLCITWTDPETGVLRKAQLDLFAQAIPLVIDYKTTRTLNVRLLPSHIYNVGWHLQATAYREAVYHLTGDWLPWVWIMSKNSPGYGCECFEADPLWFDVGNWELRQGLRDYVKALETDNWQPASLGRIRRISPPKYVVFKFGT